MSKRLLFILGVTAFALGLAAPALAGGASKTSHSGDLRTTGTSVSDVQLMGGSLTDNEHAQVDLADYSSLKYFDRLLVDPANAGAVIAAGASCSAARLSFFGKVTNWANLTGPQQGRATITCTRDRRDYRYTWGHGGSPDNCIDFERTGSDGATASYTFVASGTCVAHVALVAKTGKAGQSTATTATFSMASTVQGVVRSES